MRIAVYYLQTEVVTMIYRPLYVDKIMAYVDTPFVKILTGVRRCGKSTILKMIMERLKTQRNIPEDRIVSCRYDSMEYEDMTAKQMYAQMSVFRPMEKPICFLTKCRKSRAGKRSSIRWRRTLMLTCM